MNALDRAMGFISYKPRSRAQVMKYLREKGYESEEIEEAIATLEEYKYLDDFAFAKMYIELGLEKGRGEMRIRRELFERGVARDIIDDAWADMDEIPDQYETALQIGRNFIERQIGRPEYAAEVIGGMDYKEKEKLKAKLVRRLISRGFEYEIAYRIAREVCRGE